MIDYSDFFEHIKKNALSPFHDKLHNALENRLNARTHGDLPQWEAVLSKLPEVDNAEYSLNQNIVSIGHNLNFSDEEKNALKENLMGLHPWRKGPFHILGCDIDTEWRSDWKWDRLAPHITDLKDRMVLDVGCGSGYHCWRMRGAGAKFVLGIDPSPKFIFQFAAFKKYMPQEPVYILPLISEDMPAHIQQFDTVFSMGVLYHRKSPFEHLEELKGNLKSGGELILETLVVDGDINTVLVPGDRYAQMRNVWFLPSTAALEHWLDRIGFKNIRTVDVDQTSIDEQRATDWMTYHSLKDFLDPKDINKTVEGYPAPKRAIVIANKA